MSSQHAAGRGGPHQHSLERLVEWKNNRGDEFEKPLPGNADSHFIISVNGNASSHYTVLY